MDKTTSKASHSYTSTYQTKVCSNNIKLCLSVCLSVCGQLLLGSGVGTVRLYDTDAKKNLYEMNIDETHPR